MLSRADRMQTLKFLILQVEYENIWNDRYGLPLRTSLKDQELTIDQFDKRCLRFTGIGSDIGIIARLEKRNKEIKERGT